ncbi:MAG TPA: arsenate reductase (glutaredoxin) [Candidatus Sumerlaeota bacterium]|nr:arsenate reductase (glutaredoxin) [Candidatus Sumerlaeota bacterium]HOR28191.1 arsenate reductase (glutaredoxin) [Candidatus Sumerlaeota bacterium]HPK02092.1 arsenate reductase (glutaredoxin) [Candidatus Sumerlaeota bacterium]
MGDKHAMLSIYHNPRCSKSRETLRLLRDEGHDPRVIEYLKEPPTAAQLREIVRMLGGDAHRIVRSKEPAYAAAGLSRDSTDEEIIRAIVENPILLERPIVINRGKAALGRPPEQVLEIL